MATSKDAEKTAANLVDIINEVVEHVNKAVKHNAKLQEGFTVGSPGWNTHETIDDELHNALLKLGD